MRTVIVVILTASILTVCAGCETATKPGDLVGNGQKKPWQPTAGQPPPQTAQRTAFTAENNPTASGGRGEPSLEDFFRPAAWVYIDGQEGKYIERDGQPQVQWVIAGPVSSTPTFRAEAYEPLLGTPTDFNCVVETIDSVDGTKVAYVIAAVEGTFQVGQEYSLLHPGNGFVVRNRMTGDVVTEIALLVPGTYLFAAGIKNGQNGKEGLAITYFTVGEGE